jgi:hypothetical protein
MKKLAGVFFKKRNIGSIEDLEKRLVAIDAMQRRLGGEVNRRRIPQKPRAPHSRDSVKR